MNGRELKKFSDSNNTSCCRCRHLLNIPRDLIQTSEKISDYTGECVDDLNFVQSMVWLKSATMFMKTISVEQFHSVFYKQWKNTGKDFNLYSQNLMSDIEEDDHKNLSNSLNDDQQNDTNFDIDSEYISNTDPSRDVHNEKHNTLQPYHQQINQEIGIFTEKGVSPSVFTSSQSLDRFFNVQPCMHQDITMKNYIIQDSDEECSSVSDLIKDSLESQNTNNIVRNEKDKTLLEESDFIKEKSAELFSEDSDVLTRTLFGTRDDLTVASDDNDLSDIILSNKNYSSYKQNCSQLREQLISKSNKQIVKPLTQTCDSNFFNESPIISPNRINNTCSLQEDSAYDTYQLSAEWLPTTNCIYNEDISISPSQKIANITPYEKKDIVNYTHDLESLTIDMTQKNWTSKQNLSCSQQENDKNTNDDGEELCVQNRQRYKNLIEDAEYERSSSKRKKLKSVHETTVSKATKKEEKKISSKWLKFTLDTLNVDDIAFKSIKAILMVLQNERIAKQYMRKRCWKDTLEEQAVNAILDYCDVSEAENKTNEYTQEIVQVVTDILDKSIGTSEFNKVTILTHQISIILQLCSSMKVCVEIINYLTAKLKSYGNILISLINNKKADVHSVINQLHIIFYTLNFCLQKYRAVFCNKENNQLEKEEVIPPVVDLWKKQLNFEGIIVKDSIQTRERRWLMILDDFAVIAIENFVQFAKKAQKLVNLLTYE
ncbi:uncharacterized protein LOC117153941 [Bombus vancouverensis nearcticus]|uniref:uncharacterized protein LOC117153941 n=1 Tax=Bombus vancouverensis nearcticus TaxID=2705178 RepID=UPI00402BC3F5